MNGKATIGQSVPISRMDASLIAWLLSLGLPPNVWRRCREWSCLWPGCAMSEPAAGFERLLRELAVGGVEFLLVGGSALPQAAPVVSFNRHHDQEDPRDAERSGNAGGPQGRFARASQPGNFGRILLTGLREGSACWIMACWIME